MAEEEEHMKTFSHFIITRYNLRRRIDPPQGWLEQRTELFERFTFPSLCAQTNENFRWIVLFDMDTSPDWLKKRINSWEEKLSPNFVAWHCDGCKRETIGGCAERYIRGQIDNDPPDFLVTTRLDNDDALASNFVERLHGYIYERLVKGNLKTAEVFDFPDGLRRVEATNQYYVYHRPYSPFESLIYRYAPESRFRTVYSFPESHAAVHKYVTTRMIRDKDHNPFWLQVLHSQNISNKLRGDEKKITLDKVKGFEWLK